MPKVSIITVCRNAAETIEKTIKSIESQNYPDIEHIIIDGESTDGTQAIVKKLFNKRIACFVSEKDNGIYDAMNKGLDKSTGEVIGFLNADDFLYDESAISRVIGCFQENLCDIVHGDLVYLDRKSNKKRRYWKSSPYAKGKFNLGWMPAHPTFYVKKQIYDAYGKFRLDLKIAADYEIMFRFLEKNMVKSSYLNATLVAMHTGGVSGKNLKNIVRANIESYKSWELNGISPPNLFGFLFKPLLKVGQFFRAYFQ